MIFKQYDFAAHSGGLYALAPAPEARRFFSAGADGLLAEWDAPAGVGVRAWLQTPVPIYSLELIAARHTLCIGQYDGGLRFLNLDEEKLVKSAAAHEKPVFALLDDAPNGRIFAASGDGSFSVWSAETFACEWRLSVSGKSLRALASDGKHLAVGSSDGRIRVYALDDLRPLADFEAHDTSVFSLAFLPQSGQLASGGRDARLKIWETHDHFSLTQEVAAHHYAINSLSAPECLPYFFTGSKDKTVKIWDGQTRKLIKVVDEARLGGASASVNATLFLPEIQTLLLCGDDALVRSFSLNV